MATGPRQRGSDVLLPSLGGALPLAPGRAGRLSMAVAPIEGSALAVPVAAALARQAGLDLEVVSVQHRRASPPDPSDAVREARQAGARWAHGRSLPAARGVAAALLGRIGRGDIGLVCMATRGRASPASVTATVARRSPVPVLLVGPSVRRVAHRVRRLLVCLDGSPPSELALPVAIGLAQRLAAGLVLLRVVPDRRIAFAQMDELAYLHHVAEQITDPVPLFDVVVGRDTATAIARYAGDRGDIVVLGQRRGAARHLLRSGVAARMLLRAACPVLIVPSPQAGGRSRRSADDAQARAG
jgi:nucleotide-binding universal stress UspA family protein